MAKSISPSETCPIEIGINVLSGKWKLLILWKIYQQGTVRFNELQRQLENITTKTLTEQLRELEAQQIIDRKIYPEIPPKVEYHLSDIGESLVPILQSLCEWGKEYQQQIG